MLLSATPFSSAAARKLRTPSLTEHGFCGGKNGVHHWKLIKVPVGSCTAWHARAPVLLTDNNKETTA